MRVATHVFLLALARLTLTGCAASPAPAGTLPRAEGPEVMPALADAMWEHRSEVEYCYDEAFSHNRELSGTVVLAIEVERDGRIKNTSAIENSTGDEDLARCLSQVVTLVDFRDGRLPDARLVTYPFVFPRRERG